MLDSRQSLHHYKGNAPSYTGNTIGVRDVGRGARSPPPLKFGKKIFGQFLCKIRDFSGKNHVKLGNFVNFSGKYNKNSGIVIIFRARNM